MCGSTRFWPSLIALTLVALAGFSVYEGRSRASSPTVMDTDLFRAIARRQNPIVVAVLTTARRETPSREDIELFGRFFGRPLLEEPRIRHDAGSGFLISRDGEILTSDHLVVDADVITVRLFGTATTTYRATLVGRDPVVDTALIRLQGAAGDLPFATLGDSDQLEAGDWVVAIGNPYELGHTVTVGVVGHEERVVDADEGRRRTLIQTDASMNPGSSGGPLLNVRGEVVGINVGMLADEIGGGRGIGFAVPINDVKALLPQLRAGKVVRGHIGVRFRPEAITHADAAALGLPRATGALITSVEQGSAADAAGFRCGDVIVNFAGAPVASADDLLARVSAARPGVRIPAIVIRDGGVRTIEVEVEELLSTIPERDEPRADEAPDLGLLLGDGKDGPLVESVEDESPAAEAGIEEGDIVRKVNRRAVRTAAEATRELQRIPVGRPTFVLVWRAGRELLVEMQRD
jgi:serine protease Do